MKIFGTFAVTVLLALTVSSWAAFTPAKSCGPTLTIEDPQLRAQFATLDRQRSAESAELCVMYRDVVTQPGRGQFDGR